MGRRVKAEQRQTPRQLRLESVETPPRVLRCLNLPQAKPAGAMAVRSWTSLAPSLRRDASSTAPKPSAEAGSPSAAGPGAGNGSVSSSLGSGLNPRRQKDAPGVCLSKTETQSPA